MDAASLLTMWRTIISTVQWAPLVVQGSPGCMSAQFLSDAVWTHK